MFSSLVYLNTFLNLAEYFHILLALEVIKIKFDSQETSKKNLEECKIK